MPCQDLDEPLLILRHDLYNDTQLLAEQLREYRPSLYGQRNVEPAVAGKSHFNQRGEQAAIGAIVIREQQAGTA